MTPGTGAWGDAVRAVLPIALLGALLWLARRRGRAPGEQAEDESPGTPYHVFMTEADRAVAAREAPLLLELEDRVAGIGPPRDVDSWTERLEQVEQWAEEHRLAFPAAADALVPHLAERPAIFLLIDHSGSMRSAMIGVAAVTRWFSALCDDQRVPLSIAGFTTLGWRGGEPRRRWIARGRPARPGRLAALLHLEYRSFGAPLDPKDWQVMAHPVVLRENIDGEAIRWAASKLRGRPEPRRLLIVLSDGAPVDDSTLAENGPSFLERDVLQAIANIADRGDIELAAIGIGHAVERYYPRSRRAQSPADLPAALTALIACRDDTPG